MRDRLQLDPEIRGALDDGRSVVALWTAVLVRDARVASDVAAAELRLRRVR